MAQTPEQQWRAAYAEARMRGLCHEGAVEAARAVAAWQDAPGATGGPGIDDGGSGPEADQIERWLEDIDSGEPGRAGPAGACLAEFEPVDGIVADLVATAEAGSPTTRSAALQVLGAWQRREVTAAVRGLMASHPDETSPVVCLGRLGACDVLPAVAALLAADDPFLQGEALWIIGESGESAYGDRVLRILDPEALPLAAGEAVVALGKLRVPAARPVLIGLLHSDAAASESFVWTDPRGSRNEPVPTWRLIDSALRSLDGVAGTSDSLPAARASWPLG